MNRLPIGRRAQVLGVLVEGGSLRSASRLCDVSINTVMKLLVDVGAACAAYQDEHLRNLPCRRIQWDEIWSFVGAKAKNVPLSKAGQFGVGDVWTWTALCADTKVVPCWLVGTRDALAAREFLLNLSVRIAGRFQLTTDGHSAYPDAVERVFGRDIDYATVTKVYGADPEGEKRYSPPTVVGIQERKVNGHPDPAHISTSYVERSNLTMRMGIRRFTRLTNAFSKKVENHGAAIALHFMHYNFARIHKTLRVAPAMEAGVSNRLWTLEEIAGLAN